MTQIPYLTAKEAAGELGISLATLYAYVSRGLIRSEASGDHRRTRRYLKEDIARLKGRKVIRGDSTPPIDGVVPSGGPTFESAITLVSNEHFYYRGQEVIKLAEKYSAEEIATFIWLGELPPGQVRLFDPAAYTVPHFYQPMRALLAGLTAMDAFQIVLPMTAANDPSAYDLRPVAVAHSAARIMYLLAIIAAGAGKISGSIAATLQQSWIPAKPEAARLIDCALILCADHELNLSSYTARCTASAGSNPYAVVSAGLATVQGARHAGMTERVAALFKELAVSPNIEAALAGRLKRGEDIPGFGHPVYPHGDPRAALLLRKTAEIFPESPVTALSMEITEKAKKLIDEEPSIDFSLVILANALNLPAGGAVTLLAMGRAIGWLGHAIEQYEANRAISPHARYVGERPPQTAEKTAPPP